MVTNLHEFCNGWHPAKQKDILTLRNDVSCFTFGIIFSVTALSVALETLKV